LIWSIENAEQPIEVLSIFGSPHDGLEREFKVFNRLEGGVCTTCAPGDQEKACFGQSEQARFWIGQTGIADRSGTAPVTKSSSL
jgi:hypothetical protein